MLKGIRVDQIDHVELFVPDPYEAAKWYQSVFGLEITHEHWVGEGGPLMLSTENGATMLALFRGAPPGERPVLGFRRVAFRTDGRGFMLFLDRVDDLAVTEKGEPVTRHDAKDHGISFSIYFGDPFGHPFEVTTYDYDYVTEKLGEPS